MSDSTDLLVIGGGIVGLATACQWTRRFPGRSIRLLEKEDALATHQTGRNSGVLHSGIYYRPGSLKATNCLAGKRAMEHFCREHEIAMETCGKVIVAVDEGQLPALEQIEQRGRANGVPCRRLTPAELHEREPHARGVAALLVPTTGIVDFRQVAEKMAQLVMAVGGDLRTGCRVIRLERQSSTWHVESTGGDFRAMAVINCAGLYSDRVTRATGQLPEARIIPFRGEYYELSSPARGLCRHLIYPVPDPRLPFLGVHFTRMIDGTVECGPNAVLAWSREGYRQRDVRLRDLWDTWSYPGFWRLARRHWKTGIGEMVRSLSRRAFVRALQQLVPDVRRADLQPQRAGVRAQAVRRDGSMVDDFLLQTGPGVVHVGNAPSPAATSSLHIATTILDRLPK